MWYCLCQQPTVIQEPSLRPTGTLELSTGDSPSSGMTGVAYEDWESSINDLPAPRNYLCSPLGPGVHFQQLAVNWETTMRPLGIGSLCPATYSRPRALAETAVLWKSVPSDLSVPGDNFETHGDWESIANDPQEPYIQKPSVNESPTTVICPHLETISDDGSGKESRPNGYHCSRNLQWESWGMIVCT